MFDSGHLEAPLHCGVWRDGPDWEKEDLGLGWLTRTAGFPSHPKERGPLRSGPAHCLRSGLMLDECLGGPQTSWEDIKHLSLEGFLVEGSVAGGRSTAGRL